LLFCYTGTALSPPPARFSFSCFPRTPPRFEDECRELMGTGAYLLFTLDRLAASAAKQVSDSLSLAACLLTRSPGPAREAFLAGHSTHSRSHPITQAPVLRCPPPQLVAFVHDGTSLRLRGLWEYTQSRIALSRKTLPVGAALGEFGVNCRHCTKEAALRGSPSDLHSTSAHGPASRSCRHRWPHRRIPCQRRRCSVCPRC
jgi:hypothetical protein